MPTHSGTQPSLRSNHTWRRASLLTRALKLKALPFKTNRSWAATGGCSQSCSCCRRANPTPGPGPDFESDTDLEPDPNPNPDHRLQAQGLRVSLLYRKHVPASMQSPSSAGLAALLGVAGFDEAELLQGRP